MFSTLNAVPRMWLVTLLFIWAVLLFGGWLIAQLRNRREGQMERTTRLLSSVILVIAAWSLVPFVRRTPIGGFTLWIAGGMTLGCLGDLFMAGVLPASDQVLAGMAAFGLGHVAYITGGLLIRRSIGMPAGPACLVAWVVWLLIGAAGWYVFVRRNTSPGEGAPALQLAALAYALLLASTAGVATGLALQNLVFLPFALGAALFLFSDLLIAAGLFGRRHVRHTLIWLTYGPGQMLIVAGLSAAFG